MRKPTVAVLLLLMTLVSAGHLNGDCKCVYPWPEECNKVCFYASGTVESYKGDTVVLDTRDKKRESFVVPDDVKGKANLKEGQHVQVYGSLEGDKKVIKSVKRTGVTKP